MRPIVILIGWLFVLCISCTKGTSDTVDVIDMPAPPIDSSITSILYEGSFENGPYGVISGKAKILKTGTKLQLRLEGFEVSNGPDLKVYLSEQVQPVDFFRIGSLKAFRGDQLYDINSNPDFEKYRYVLIHCEKFNHLFGSALMMKK